VRTTTIGNLLVDQALPEQYRQGTYDLDKKGIETLLDKMSREMDPDDYKLVLQKLNILGQKAAISAGTSVSLSSLKQGPKSKLFIQGVKDQVRAVQLDKSLTSDAKNKKIIDLLVGNISNIRDSIFNEGLEAESPFAIQAKSGSRGNANQLMQLVTGDGMVEDFKKRPIPVPILHGYAEGLSPAEYFAGSYGARQGSACLHEDTLVLMGDYSTKRISQLKVGDWIMGADLTGDMSPTRVVRVYDQGRQICNTYTFRKNNSREILELVATPNHRMLARLKGNSDSYIGPTAVKEPDAVALYRGTYNCGTKNKYVANLSAGQFNLNGLDEPLALLFGLMIGDGCTALSTKGQYQFSCADPELVRDINEYGSTHGFHIQKTGQGYSYLLKDTTAGNAIKAAIKTFVGECLAHEKKLPLCVWSWNDRSICNLIAGLIATDGSVYNCARRGKLSIGFSSTSKDLVVTLRRLLELRLGVWCTNIHFVAKETKSWAIHDQYEFDIVHPQSIQRFVSRIKLPGCKQLKLTLGLEKSAKPNYRNSKHTAKAVSMEVYGLCQTYDIEVEHPDHLFVLANGLVSHNSTKLSTASSGAALKQLVQASHKVVVTEQDCGTNNGLPVDANDPDNDGALLAQPVGDYGRDFVINGKFIKSQTGTVVVRSPLTCQAKNGICAKCAGIRERGRLPDIGDNIGIPASQALGEKLTSGALGAKHSGGQVKGKRIQAEGFKFIEGLMQSNANLVGLATVSEKDGRVKAITPAPQGGNYIQFDDDQYYIPSEQEPIVKVGDEVEAGDMLSNGVPDPSAVTRLKGIGEGRKLFTKIFTEAFKNTGHTANRRNVEAVARGLINHVQITDPNGYGDYLPDDVVNYDELLRSWQPREGTKKYRPNLAKNKFLEAPVLNYSVGTRISPKIAADLEYNKVKEVDAHDDPPPFEPINVRAIENAYRDPNWMTRMSGSYLERGFEEAVNRGRSADTHTQSYVPSLAEGVNFGKTLKTTGTY